MKFLGIIAGNVRSSIVDFFVLLTGLSTQMVARIIIIVLLYILFLRILLKIHKFFKKKELSVKKKLVEGYDKVFYLLARRQYRTEIDKESIGGDPCIAAIRPLLKEGNRNYISNYSLIKNNVKKVEKLLGELVISDSDRNKLLHLNHKLSRISFMQKIFGILLSVITVGVYLLFC